MLWGVLLAEILKIQYVPGSYTAFSLILSVTFYYYPFLSFHSGYQFLHIS